MSIYQFMIAVRGQDGMQLTNEAGETTRWGSFLHEDRKSHPDG